MADPKQTFVDERTFVHMKPVDKEVGAIVERPGSSDRFRDARSRES
jgi:hypothetical protein